jgi:phosphoglycerol transferase MdoB-like AlkP superfamily enzyme
MENLINCKLWPESDNDMIKATFEEYANNEHFMTYMMTVSGHHDYNFAGDNSMALRHKNDIQNLEGLSEAAKAYVATQIELDKALESLINLLEEKGILDNTVIVLLADHYPYELSLNDINSLSSYTRDNVVEVNHNNLIIWNSKMKNVHVTKPCMSSDVLPTVYNLFGIDYDSRLFTGRDILSDSQGLVILRDHSWVTDKGTYFASSGKFVGDESVDQEYIKNINATVNNRLNISKLILSTDYYRYLLGN